MLSYKLYSYKCSKITKKVRWERAKFCDHKQTDSMTIQLPFSQAQQEWSYSKESISTSLGNRTIATMVPTKLEFLQESDSGRRKKLKSGAIQSRNLTGKRFHSSNDLSDHHTWADGTMMGQWRTEKHLDQDCSIIYMHPTFCLNLNLMLWSQNRLRRSHIALFFFSVGPY